MSDLVDEINRLEAWVRNYGHQKQPEFIADLRTLIAAAKTISRALQVLQNLDRYNVEPCSRMEWRKDGDWVDFCSVSKAIQILEGQQ